MVLEVPSWIREILVPRSVKFALSAGSMAPPLIDSSVSGVKSQSDLLHVVGALRPRRGVADLLDGRHKQSEQKRQDGQHHQELDHPKAAPLEVTSQQGIHGCPSGETEYARQQLPSGDAPGV